MGSMTGKQTKIDAALSRLANMIDGGNVLASVDPVGFLDTIVAELKDLRFQNMELRGRVKNLEDNYADLQRNIFSTFG